MWLDPLQGSITGTAWSALHRDEVSYASQYATVFSLYCICHTGTWRLQKIHWMWMLFVNSAVWLQSISCHSHPALQLSGLMSSCRVRPCLPSGLQCLPDSDDTITPSQYKSELKETPHINALGLNLAWHSTQMLLPPVKQLQSLLVHRPDYKEVFDAWGELFVR